MVGSVSLDIITREHLNPTNQSPLFLSSIVAHSLALPLVLYCQASILLSDSNALLNNWVHSVVEAGSLHPIQSTSMYTAFATPSTSCANIGQHPSPIASAPSTPYTVLFSTNPTRMINQLYDDQSYRMGDAASNLQTNLQQPVQHWSLY